MRMSVYAWSSFLAEVASKRVDQQAGDSCIVVVSAGTNMPLDGQSWGVP